MSTSKVSTDAYRNAPIKIWIAHQDGTVNNTLVVFKWRGEKQKLYMFRKAKQQLQNYRGPKIREARFYENVFKGQLLGTMTADGVFHDQMAFLNSL